MHLIDLHCDTLYKATTTDVHFNSENIEVKLNPATKDCKLQCYAIWIPDEYTGDEAENLFFKAADIIKKECEQNNIKLIKTNEKINDLFFNHKNTAYFTVENSLALNSKIENVKRFSDLGVKMMTLTWNDSNDVGDGTEVKQAKGLTPFGKAVIEEMEKHNIIVDVSHASEKLFYDVTSVATRSFVASHSNSFSVTSHKRNLTDEQFKIIKERNGLVGINFHKDFLSNNPDEANILDILKHTDHFLSLGGESIICFGSDFDGCILAQGIKDSFVMDEIYELFLKHNYNEGLIRKIFYENALNFFENFDNQRIM